MNEHLSNESDRAASSAKSIGVLIAGPAAASAHGITARHSARRAMAAVAATLIASSLFAFDDNDADLREQAQKAFPPLPRDAGSAEFPITPERVRLGQMLFFEPRISADGTGSCVRCHQPSLYGADALPKSIALGGRVLPRNAPTILNSAIQKTQHWDGGFANVEAQATKALLGPGFGNKDFPTAVARLKAIPGYAAEFHAAFPSEADPINEANWGKAIGAYERTLIAPSRFDDFLSGKIEALSASERKGLRTFMETGCAECHGGPGGGGTSFRKFGVISDYRKLTGSSSADKGRFDLTKNPDDTDKFKVPVLRGVAMTAPYFHDGSVNELPRAVRIMAKVQLDTDLEEEDVRAIVDFLTSLTGPVPIEFARPPLLPAGGFINPPAH